MFDNFHDADSRLRNTVIRYKRRPIFITRIYEDLTFEATYMKSGNKTGRININDTKIDYSPVPLGYCNQYGDTFYLSRIPARMWKQGLCSENLNASGGTRHFNFDHFTISQTIDGKYPSLHSCIERVKNKEAYGCAFHRDWAAVSNTNRRSGEMTLALAYKGSVVGSFKDGAPVLDSKFGYLTEALEEALQ